VVAELGGLRSLLELEKLIGALIMPAGLVWLALGVLALACAARGRRRLAWMLAGLFLLDGCAGNAWLGGALMAGLEHGAAPIDIASVEPFDVVVTLGGGTDTAPDGRAQVGPAGDRVLIAAELFAAGKAACLAATGSSIAGYERPHDSASEAVAIWRALGVPEPALVPLSGPRTTSEEVARIETEAAERGWKRIGLATSAWHLPRALRLCRAAGLTVVPIPCDWRGQPPPWSLAWLVPCDRGFVGAQRACWEWLGMIVGR
jgi:uncharacterized SAM-binding protein YcdF (DUF218 family)